MVKRDRPTKGLRRTGQPAELRSAVVPPRALDKDRCRACGRELLIDTDGSGALLELELDGRSVHECPT